MGDHPCGNPPRPYDCHLRRHDYQIGKPTSDHLIGVEGDDLILIGKMGVWEATTHVSQSDVVKLFWLLLRSLPVWAYLLRLPLTVNRKAKISNFLWQHQLVIGLLTHFNCSPEHQKRLDELGS